MTFVEDLCCVAKLIDFTSGKQKLIEIVLIDEILIDEEVLIISMSSVS